MVVQNVMRCKQLLWRPRSRKPLDTYLISISKAIIRALYAQQESAPLLGMGSEAGRLAFPEHMKHNAPG